MSELSPSALRFANALARRLDAVVPAGLAVRADGYLVNVYGHGSQEQASAIASLVEEADQGTVGDRLETAAWGILSGVQDCVAHLLTEPWPRTPEGSMALPGTRLDGSRVLMWFGDEESPVVALPALHAGEVSPE